MNVVEVVLQAQVRKAEALGDIGRRRQPPHLLLGAEPADQHIVAVGHQQPLRAIPKKILLFVPSQRPSGLHGANVVHPQQGGMGGRHVPGGANCGGGPERNNGAGGDVQPQIAQGAGPALHQLQNRGVIVGKRQPQHPVRVVRTEHGRCRRTAAHGPFDVQGAAAGGNHHRASCTAAKPAVASAAGEDDVLLKHVVPAECAAAGAERMNGGRLHELKKRCAKLPEVRPRSKAARHDVHEPAGWPQHRRAHRHEQGVDVGLAMHDAGRGQGPGVVAANLEVRRIGDDGVIVPVGRTGGKQLPKGPQGTGFGGDEVCGFNSRFQADTTAAAPIRQVRQHGAQGAKQVRIVLVGGQLNAGRRLPAGGEALHRSAAQNAGAGRRVQQPQRLAGDLDLRRHEVRHWHWRQVQPMRLAVLA